AEVAAARAAAPEAAGPAAAAEAPRTAPGPAAPPQLPPRQMTRRRDTTSIVASPLLVGAVTVLATVVAVFLAYNANQGLPFVPTYDVNVEVPDAAGLVRANEVRIGGFRVGIVKAIQPVPGPSGHPIARLHLQLEKTIEPILSDTTVVVRPRS